MSTTPHRALHVSTLLADMVGRVVHNDGQLVAPLSANKECPKIDNVYS